MTDKGNYRKIDETEAFCGTVVNVTDPLPGKLKIHEVVQYIFSQWSSKYCSEEFTVKYYGKTDCKKWIHPSFFIKSSLILMKLEIWKELLSAPHCLTVKAKLTLWNRYNFIKDSMKKTLCSVCFLSRYFLNFLCSTRKRVCFLFIIIPVQN